jgi:hypothetical protein
VPRLPLAIAAEPPHPEIPLYEGDLKADLHLVSRNRLAEQITGGLSYPSKMDCPSWGIPATRCRIGSLLARQPGAVCHDCYALRGTFKFKGTQEKLAAAYRGLGHRLWVPSLVFLVRWYAADRFRWFHSGDLQGISHLRNIIRVCLETPDVRHWLPTRERDVVLACRDQLPLNLTVRASATRVDGPPPAWWPVTSTVVTGGSKGVCPSSLQGGSCDDYACHACWDQDVPNVAYRRH